ncbi:MAG: ABC transporter ATP-binding protein [Candidatus Competibacterales bacterium]
MAFLELKALHKRFGDVAAVAGVDLAMERGEFFSLLGPSGCGKSTSLQLIDGFERPDVGQVIIDGQDVTELPANRRGIGIVFQSYALFPHMTVGQNVSFGLEMRRIKGAERHRRVGETLDLVGLGALTGRFPRELSGGQRQRVALARALAIQPALLLLDEPLSALDAKIREEMQMELRGLQRSLGTTTLLVTHDQTEALSMSDRVAVMDQGKLVQVGAPFDTYEFPRDPFVSQFLGKTNLLAGRLIQGSDGTPALELAGRPVAIPPHLVADLPGDAQVQLALRPEKLTFVPSEQGMLQGQVRARLFLGNHWLYQLTSAAGELLVSVENSGCPGPAEGETTGITWSSDAARVLGS